MSFLAPLMLFGSAAASIPLILHFFYRARYKPTPWAAMRFLRLAVEQTSRRLRFQELILLILRILLMLILAMALSRPVMCSNTGGSGNRGEAVDAIFIVDLSYSMNTQEGAKSTLDRLKETALTIIDELPANSTVQVITCTDRATAVGPRSPRNLDQARELVKSLRAVQQSTDFLPGFTEAAAALNRTEGASKEVYLFSDMQRDGFERQSSPLRAKCEEIKARASLFFVRGYSKKIHNATLTDLRPQSEIPHTRSRMAFTAFVKNTGTEPLGGLKVTLKVDGEAGEGGDEQAIAELAPGDTRAVTLTGKFETPGRRLVTAELSGDSLIDDNRFDKIILVREAVRILIVDGNLNEREPEKSGSYYFGHALLPIPDEFKAAYHVQVSVVRASEAGPGMLTDRELCILADAPLAGAEAVPDDFTQALAEFVKTGRGLMISCGPRTDPDAYNRILGDTLKLLPAPLGEVFEAPKDAAIFPDPNTIDGQSFLARFRLASSDPFLQLKDATILRGFTLREGSAEGGRTLIRYSDGRPCLLSKRIGEGEVLLLTASADKDWGFFATCLAFPPFIQGAMIHLIDRSQGRYNRTAAESIRWTPSAVDRNYDLVRPDGERVRLGRPTGGTGESLGLAVADISRAGVYRITAEGEDSGERFAVVPDLRESDSFDAMGESAVNELLGFTAEHIVSAEDAGKKTESLRNRNEWTITFLLFLLLFAVGESAWAWYCGKAW